ncbi:MAG: glycosyltransferase [Planctomycetes bacterium]|nr:glycosyltransferase [Planctomycetota bacterium]
MDISIVIPAFEEAKKIAHDMQVAAQFLQDYNFAGEIIVVDDGSSDTTTNIARQAGDQLGANVTSYILRSEQNCGKGNAVKRGVNISTGDYVMFADCGCCVPYENVLDGLELIKNNHCEIAHGSRVHAKTKITNPQTLYRRLCSVMFRFIVSRLTKIPGHLTDTQCGFKVYKGSVARELYADCITEGFMFDIEIILRAQKAGYRIKEFPITWTCDRDTRLHPAKTIGPVLKELKKIKKSLN